MWENVKSSAENSPERPGFIVIRSAYAVIEVEFDSIKAVPLDIAHRK
jgi:hypothetical protein